MGEVGVTPCGHHFHFQCWSDLSDSTPGQRPPLCPICRRVVNSDLEVDEIGTEVDESIDAIAAAPCVAAINDIISPDAKASSPDTLPVDAENQSSFSVSSGSSSAFTNGNFPDLSNLQISDQGNELDRLMENLRVESIECGWIAGGQRNQCFTLSISASIFHARTGSVSNWNAITQAAVIFDRAITMAIPRDLRHQFFRRGENQAIDSDVLEYIISNHDSQFSNYAFVIVSEARQRFIQAWVGDRYHTGLDTDETRKRRNTIMLLFSTTGFSEGHYTALIPESGDIGRRPILDEICDQAAALGITVETNNHIN